MTVTSYWTYLGYALLFIYLLVGWVSGIVMVVDVWCKRDPYGTFQSGRAPKLGLALEMIVCFIIGAFLWPLVLMYVLLDSE